MERIFNAEKKLILFFSIIAIIWLIVLCIASIVNFSDAAKNCDVEKGYKCSYYEVRNYMIRGN